LTDSAACLVSDKDDLSANMERILKATGTEAPSNKRILEINPDHKLIEVLNNLFEKDSTNPKLKSYCELIYEQALLTEGSQLKDPVNFTKKITQIMLEAVGETGKSRIITI
jgi:molecular chaperone HtpG